MPRLFPYAVGSAFLQTQEESGRSPHFSVKLMQNFSIWIPCAPRLRHIVADSVRATFAPYCYGFHARHVRAVLLQTPCAPRSRRVIADSMRATFATCCYGFHARHVARISDQLIGCHCIAFAVRSMAASSLLRFSFMASAIIISFTFIRRV